MHAVVVASLIVAAVQAPAPTRLQRVMLAPRTTFGDTVESLERVMRREPDASSLVPTPNPHSSIPNGRLVLDYGGVVAALLISTSGAKADWRRSR